MTISNADLVKSGLAASSVDNQAAVDSVDAWVGSGEGMVGKLLPGPLPNRMFSMFLMVPAVIAFSISCYLAYVSMTSSKIAACGSGVFNCEHVFNTKFSSVFGQPVSLMAAGTYLLMLVSLFQVTYFNRQNRLTQLAWLVITLCGISAGMAAIYFTCIQHFEIKHYCPWCLGAHACGLIIAISLLIRRPVGIGKTIACTGLAAAGLGVMAGAQFSSEDPKSYTIEEIAPQTTTETDENGTATGEDDEEDIFAPPMDASTQPVPSRAKRTLPSLDSALIALTTGFQSNISLVSYQEETEQEEKKQETEAKKERRKVTILGKTKLYSTDWPLLGKPDAKHIFVEMFDYACPHCRNTHRAIRGAREAMGDEVAVIVLPVPLNSACNSSVTSTKAMFSDSCRVAELAVACWRCDAAKFEEFHEWMFEGAMAPNYDTAKAKVVELVGSEAIEAELKKEAAKKYIQKHVYLYKQANAGSVPKIMFPNSNILGEFTSATDLVRMIKQRAK